MAICGSFAHTCAETADGLPPRIRAFCNGSHGNCSVHSPTQTLRHRQMRIKINIVNSLSYLRKQSSLDLGFDQEPAWFCSVPDAWGRAARRFLESCSKQVPGMAVLGVRGLNGPTFRVSARIAPFD